MFWRGVSLCVAAALLSGCASQRTGFDYTAIAQKIGPPRRGQSRIVVLQEKTSGISGAYCIWDMQLDGGSIGRLKPGTYVYSDRPAGRHELVAGETLFPGETRRDIKTESGHTYFFLTKTSDRHNSVTSMALLGGLTGAIVASAVTSGSDNPGPVDFFLLDEASARTTIAELQLAE